MSASSLTIRHRLCAAVSEGKELVDILAGPAAVERLERIFALA